MGTGRYLSGIAGNGRLPPGDPSRTEGIGSAANPSRRTDSPAWWRAEEGQEKDPTLVADLEKLVEATTRGDPELCLRCTCKSVRRLAEELEDMGHRVSYPVVAELLHELDYSLQANRKTKEGDKHPDRNAQFEYINAQVQQYIGRRQPVISVGHEKERVAGRFQE